MKKVLLAALAIAAMASCAKNEPAVQLQQSDSPISFLPVVGNSTKASYLTTANMKDNCQDFGVFAWRSSTQPFAYDGVTAFMSDVKVSYKKVGDIIPVEDGVDSWFPVYSYYWPKGEYLTFEAYAPYDDTKINVTSTAEKGLTITGYTIENDIASQIDLLYTKERTFDKQASSANTNDEYDGVDINFKHALSAIEIYARNNDASAADNAIQITKVEIVNAYNKGTFNQNYTSGRIASPEAAAWTVETASDCDYTVLDATTSIPYVALPSAGTHIGTAILMPQDLGHTTPSADVEIVVTYQINSDGGYIAQTPIPFTLKIQKDASDNTIDKWEINKKYIYTLVFDLDKIFFAPAIADDWTEVTIKDITIK